MVIGVRTSSKLRGRGDESFTTKRKEQVVESPDRRYHVPNTIILNRDEEEEDVIDLGAPRHRRPASAPRLPRLYTPNPRLYPGPKTKIKATRNKRQGGRTEDSRPRQQRKRKFTRPVPNSRLYRPAPPRPPPPAPRPHAAWPPPAPRALESASRAALRVLHARRLGARDLSPVRAPRDPPAPPAPLASYTARAPRLVVTLPAAGDARSAMATHKHSTSPDCSDGNDPSSAPSEFLAEFLSAIMRRQYAEALKYCQLILQYEPHNATARGFYPLLRHKLRAPPSPSPRPHAAKEESSSSEETSPRHDNLLDPQIKQSAETEGSAEGSGSEEMDQGSGSGSGSGSGACSSLELDSSEARSAPTSPRRTDTTDPSDSSSWRWDSGGSHSERDDNGNPAPRLAAEEPEGAADDARNDNSLIQIGDGLPENQDLNKEKAPEPFAPNKNSVPIVVEPNESENSQAQSSSMSSLQRLRAHFACSIK